MAVADVSRLGQVNQANDELALFLKKFAGEVLAKYNESVVMEGKHLTRSIENGKSASFPAVGGIDAEYHVPGTELTGLGVNHNERIIPIDGLLLSHAFLANIDEAMNHFDVRSIYSNQMGATLGKKYDVNVAKEIIAGARATGLTTDMSGGTVIEAADLASGTATATRVQAIVDALFAAAAGLDDKEAPDLRYCVLTSADYYALVQTVQTNGFSAIHKDIGGAGSFADGKVFNIAGINILKSTSLPQTDTSATDTYHGIDAATTTGIVWCPEAVGTVKLMDLAAEAAYDIRRQGWLMVTKMAVGHGWLRPECCVEFRSADPAL